MRKREEKDLKPSGYIWLGDIPNSWKVIDFKYLFNICKQVSTEKEPVVLSLGMSGVKIRDTSNNEGQLAASYENYALIKKGQFALNPMDLISGAVAISPYEGVMSNAYKIFTQEGSKYDIMMSPEYYEYLLRYHYDNKVFLPFGKGVGRSESGGGRWTLNTETLNNFPMLLPPLKEQQRIAAFLDVETGKVDNLVDEFTKFKTQLQTQRKSLISECVTKGVPEDRDREYKDSGVEWLGEIPVEWGYGEKLGLLINIISGFPFPSDSFNIEEKGYPLVRIRDIVRGYTETYADVAWEEKAAVTKGDILVGMDGDFNIAIWESQPALLNQRACKVEGNNSGRIFNKFLYYALPTHLKVINDLTYATTVKHLSSSDIKAIKMPVPPTDEQQRIADYLDTETAKIDALIGEIDNQVNLLKTYRKSLINEVVTGKIEV